MSSAELSNMRVKRDADDDDDDDDDNNNRPANGQNCRGNCNSNANAPPNGNANADSQSNGQTSGDDQSTTDDDVGGKVIEIDIKFKRQTIIRGFYGAWNIKEVSYTSGDNYFTATDPKEPEQKWSFKHPSSMLGPSSVPLPFSVSVKKLKVSIEFNRNQKIPYFDVLGCQAEGMFLIKSVEDQFLYCFFGLLAVGEIDVPPRDTDESFSYTRIGRKIYDVVKRLGNSSNHTYEDINSMCQAKGGHLAVPDTPTKVQSIKAAIKSHIATFDPTSPTYLLGITS